MSLVAVQDYKIKGRKRQRANVPHAPLRPETKVFWPINTTGNTSDDVSTALWYPHPNHWGNQAALDANGHLWSYYARALYWPVPGSNSYNRIGKKITAKLMRFKGFFTCNYNMVRPVRVRLYYIYYKEHTLQNNNVSQFKKYCTNLSLNDTAVNATKYCTWNYYDGVWRDSYINTPEFFKTKVGEWYFRPIPPILAPGRLITSRSLSVSGEGTSYNYEMMLANGDYAAAYCVPFDKTVYLNQEVICDQDTHYLYWECDDPCGTVATSITYYNLAATPNRSSPAVGLAKDEPPVYCQFKLSYYFQE